MFVVQSQEYEEGLTHEYGIEERFTESGDGRVRIK